MSEALTAWSHMISGGVLVVIALVIGWKGLCGRRAAALERTAALLRFSGPARRERRQAYLLCTVSLTAIWPCLRWSMDLASTRTASPPA